jgi:hypothetical protein
LTDSITIFSGVVVSAVSVWPFASTIKEYYVYKPETKYSLIVEANGQTLTAETTTPEKMVIESVKDATYRCKGESIPVPHINTNNIAFTASGIVPTGDIDTVMYQSGECFTESFASYPFFEIDFNAEDYSTVRILSLALEDKEWGLEPKDMDYNSNGFRDSTYINLIYDTTRVYTIWKGPYYRDEDNNPYRQNPFVWTVETSPIAAVRDTYNVSIMGRLA